MLHDLRWLMRQYELSLYALENTDKLESECCTICLENSEQLSCPKQRWMQITILLPYQSPLTIVIPTFRLVTPSPLVYFWEQCESSCRSSFYCAFSLTATFSRYRWQGYMQQKQHGGPNQGTASINHHPLSGESVLRGYSGALQDTRECKGSLSHLRLGTWDQRSLGF